MLPSLKRMLILFGVLVVPAWFLVNFFTIGTPLSENDEGIPFQTSAERITICGEELAVQEIIRDGVNLLELISKAVSNEDVPEEICKNFVENKDYLRTSVFYASVDDPVKRNYMTQIWVSSETNGWYTISFATTFRVNVKTSKVFYDVAFSGELIPLN